MKATWHDRLARALQWAADRRQVLGGLVIAGLTPVLSLVEGDAKKRRNKRRRKKEQRRQAKTTLKVMSRNLYLGADLTPLFSATSPEQLIAAGTAMFATVRETGFPARAALLAAEILAEDPHIIGLQEVSLWRTQTPSDGISTPNAEDVAYDFLATLLDELAQRGGHYEAVATIQNFDGEIPIQGDDGLIDLRLTDRGVILARTDLPRSELAISNARSANFETNAVIPNPVLGDVTTLRGWTAVDVTRKGIKARVVSTHLETVAPPVQIAQGEELLSGPLNTNLPALLLGDLNSDANGQGTPGQTDTPTYQNLLDAGFVDAWPSGRPRAESETCCQAENLQNEEPRLSERIDFILSRGAVTAQEATRVGADPEERTPSGLWPSDHAGVAALVRLKRT